MDSIPQDRLPVVVGPDVDDAARALGEVDAAIELVSRGLASRVRLAGLPEIDLVLGVALARAQAADLDFHIDRTGASPGLTIGPRR